ncbi:hypothetical protein NQ315_007926 [Exocentrus adspersus]|uniref:U1-type domain-containing protein n=1 Tax=Exocentrus adspersus TaxID=1586481 RepID=A0AAV8W9I5_9CUCU|nr:hypothetical protein NQ315_007926 [Exocentrus adspersus]
MNSRLIIQPGTRVRILSINRTIAVHMDTRIMGLSTLPRIHSPRRQVTAFLQITGVHHRLQQAMRHHRRMERGILAAITVGVLKFIHINQGQLKLYFSYMHLYILNSVVIMCINNVFVVAVAQEMQQQRAQLAKQREDYVKKVSVLRHELDQLRLQKQELVGDSSTDRDLANILRENDKLQEEIQGKMKAIHNVIEMLSSIIKDGRTLPDLESALEKKEDSPHSPPAQSNKYYDINDKVKSQSPETNKSAIDKYCYVHYDTGLHWCWLCDEFPETAKDFLLHLQDKKHREMAKENDVDNTPWHKLPPESILPADENAPKKRVPIKGLQFFISAPSWYCKLCDIWIGDLHCASHHLKSKTHYQNYEEKKKKKRSKKRKKHVSESSSSSSSSDSSSDDEKADRSRSIRVAMRNMKQVQSIMEEDLTSKWNVLERLVQEHKLKEEREQKEKEKVKEVEDPLINQWMTVSQPPEKDKRLLEDLKDRMKQKQEQEKARQVELEKIQREKEKEEREILERQQRAAKEAEEEAERERKRKEQEELERIRNKDRDQVRFKTNYRRRRTPSRSDEEGSPRHDKYRHERHKSDNRRESRSERPRERTKSKSRSRTPVQRRSTDRRSTERRSTDRRSIDRRSSENKSEDNSGKKKPPGPPSYKKLPFIGRMPLFKNKKVEDKEEKKEIQKESYETPRRTRFQPGNLARAFIPKPDVVCFPKLSSIPPLNIPPPPTVSESAMKAPEPPKISKPSAPKAPPPPKIAQKEEIKAPTINLNDEEMLYAETRDVNVMNQYYTGYNNSVMYSQQSYQYPQSEMSIPPPPSVQPSHIMPLEPPPLPPDDDLALLGICADDMAAQTF